MFHSQHTTNENLKLQFTTTLLISLLLRKFLKSASLSGTWASAASPRPGTGFVVPTLHSSPTLTILSWSPPGAKPQFWAILWCSCFHLHQILLSLTGEPIPRLPQFTEIQSSKKYFLRAGRKKKQKTTRFYCPSEGMTETIYNFLPSHSLILPSLCLSLCLPHHSPATLHFLITSHHVSSCLI